MKIHKTKSLVIWEKRQIDLELDRCQVVIGANGETHGANSCPLWHQWLNVAIGAPYH